MPTIYDNKIMYTEKKKMNTTHQHQLPHHNKGEHYHKGRTTKDEQMPYNEECKFAQETLYDVSWALG